jgi:uncharacterized protein
MRVDIVTDMALSGAVAQYGRGMVEDVSRQLVSSFADCLRSQLAVQEPEEVRAAVAQQAEPVSGLRLGVAALGRSAARFLGRLISRR